MPHKVDSFASAFGIRRSSEKELAEFEDDARKIVNACSKFDFGGDAVACVERFLGFVSRRDLSPLLGSFLSETVSGPVEAQIVDSAHSQAVARAIATMPHPVHRCLAPGCCATAGKRKHVITRAGTLAAIGEASAAGNVVYKYSYDRFRRTADLSPEGLGQAATFPGFCDGCDNTLFRSLRMEPSRLIIVQLACSSGARHSTRFCAKHVNAAGGYIVSQEEIVWTSSGVMAATVLPTN